jgi:hypothetical protein
MRPANLVSRQGQHVRADILDIERHLAGGLHTVTMKNTAMLTHDPGDVCNRLQRASLVVCPHDRDHEVGLACFSAVCGNGTFQLRDINDPVAGGAYEVD